MTAYIELQIRLFMFADYMWAFEISPTANSSKYVEQILTGFWVFPCHQYMQGSVHQLSIS